MHEAAVAAATAPTDHMQSPLLPSQLPPWLQSSLVPDAQPGRGQNRAYVVLDGGDRVRPGDALTGYLVRAMCEKSRQKEDK